MAIGVLGLSLLAAGSSRSGVFAEDEEIHPVVGRWNVVAETGGAVWTFQPDGQLLLIGPGEIDL